MDAQAVICDLSGLFQSWHAFLDLDMNLSVMLDRLQAVLFYDILQGLWQLYPHVLLVIHWNYIIENLDVKCAKPGTRCGQCAA